ncbi:hypothetical protein ACFYTS_17725 [Nocardia sp. NPDC004151]|uniref:hypothetical protein n=1 Tax=Nocardia sp. NPDC004151 TaxID=3364304 RepID=UPI0036902BA9
MAAANRTAEAAKILEPALTRCAEQGLVRLVVDSGRQLQPVIETIYDATTSDQRQARGFLRQVLTEFEYVLPNQRGLPENY